MRPGPHVLFGVPVVEPHYVQAPGLVELGDLALMPARAWNSYAMRAPNAKDQFKASSGNMWATKTHVVEYA